jgi:hypothetical protein
MRGAGNVAGTGAKRIAYTVSARIREIKRTLGKP